MIENHVDAIVHRRSVDFDQLATHKRVDLKAICEALGRDTGGREFELFIDRILTFGGDAESSEMLKRSTQQLDLYPKNRTPLLPLGEGAGV